MTENALSHDELALDLAAHLSSYSTPMVVWTDMQLGPSGSARPDVYTIEKTYTALRARAFEIKISRSDFLSDVTSGKYLKYGEFAELVEMAGRIGVQRKWIQYPGTPKEHFDIALSKKALAVAAGAVPITLRQCATMSHRRRVTGRARAPRRRGAMAPRPSPTTIETRHEKDPRTNAPAKSTHRCSEKKETHSGRACRHRWNCKVVPVRA